MIPIARGASPRFHLAVLVRRSSHGRRTRNVPATAVPKMQARASRKARFGFRSDGESPATLLVYAAGTVAALAAEVALDLRGELVTGGEALLAGGLLEALGVLEDSDRRGGVGVPDVVGDLRVEADGRDARADHGQFDGGERGGGDPEEPRWALQLVVAE